MPLLYLGVGLLIGAVIGLIVARARSARLSVQVEERNARLAELQAMLDAREEALRKAGEQRAALQASLDSFIEARTKLEETFKALAGETLKANSESFLNLARSHLETLVAREDTHLEKRREAIEKLMRPLSDDLKKYEAHLKEIEKARVEGYAGLREQALGLADAQEKLRRETSNLTHALRHPQTRGRWGELTLRRAAELAGMVPHCDFSEQVSVVTAEGRPQRPDMIVHLPAGREIVVDSKVSLSAYLDALDAPDEAQREKKMLQHANQVRAHMDGLSRKEYGRQFEKAPEFIVLFLPGESFFAAAAHHDPELIEDGMKRGILIATPSTLVALLLAVAKGWREAGIEENARQVCETGTELYERFGTLFDHLAGVGSALRNAVKSYDKAAASVSSRLLPSLRRIQALGTKSLKEIPPLESIEAPPRPLERLDGTLEPTDETPSQ